MLIILDHKINQDSAPSIPKQDPRKPINVRLTVHVHPTVETDHKNQLIPHYTSILRIFETFRPPNKISHFLKELKLYIVHQETRETALILLCALYRYACIPSTKQQQQQNKQTKIKFTHLVDDLQNCLDLQKKKINVNNCGKINDYKMPSQKSTLCALFMDQMTTRKQNENKEKQTNNNNTNR